MSHLLEASERLSHGDAGTRTGGEAGADADLPTWENVEIGRLHEEVNHLCTRLGDPARYPVMVGPGNAGAFAEQDAGSAAAAAQCATALLAASEKRYRTLFDLSPVAVYVIDAAGIIREFNRHATELWGRVPKIGDTDALFCGSHQMFLPDGTLLPHHRCPMATVVSGEITEARDAEVVIEREDMTRVTVIVNIVPLKNGRGDIIGAINCFYDITERSRMEREIRARTLELAELHLRKDEFLAMLSHELRNPLAPIMTAVHILRLQDNENQLHRKACEIIERQVGQLVHLVDDLMEVARITSGKIALEKKPIAIAELLRRAIETTHPIVSERRHTLTLAVPVDIAGLFVDADRMEQVLVNLIGNAAKYTEVGGHIRITARQDGALVTLQVRDSGIGISAEMLPHIFDLFTQADRSLDRARGGLGIGLSLAKQLVDLHGGSIEVNSVLGQGSAFTVSMPACDAAVLQVGQEDGGLATPTQTPCRVLVVDDNIDGALSQAALLEACGYEVRVVHDGLAVLDAALAFLPEVILLDIGLPGMNGYEVARAVRRELVLHEVLLVAMTGYGLESDRRQSREAGFDHHLVKPTDFTEVQKIMAAARERRSR